MHLKQAFESAEEPDTKSRILVAALQVFADVGYDNATLREITTVAGVNIAAVNYHFGSKQALMREVFSGLARPANAIRFAALDACEREAKDRAPSLAKIVEALVGPLVRFSRDREQGGYLLMRLVIQTRALPQQFTNTLVAEQFDPVARRFVDALSRALPGLSRAEVFWRYDFAIGAMMHVISDADRGHHRLLRLSDGLCNTDDPESIVTELVRFIVAGLRAPARTEHKKMKSGRKHHAKDTRAPA